MLLNSKKGIEKKISPLLVYPPNGHYLSLRNHSSYFKNKVRMKTSWKKRVAISKLTLIRNFFFSILFFSFMAFILYILINSPA